MKVLATIGCTLCLLGLAPSAAAEVQSASDDGFVLRWESDVSASPGAVYDALGRIGAWWNSAHTYSGDARFLTMPLQAGACFCEIWPGGSIVHGRVALAMPGQTVRLDAPLGPLQELGVTAALTIALAPADAGSRVSMTYQVSGRESLDLDALAPIVDRVLTEQMDGLKRYAEQAGGP